MNRDEKLRKLRNVWLSLRAHPDNLPNSEFEIMMNHLEELMDYEESSSIIWIDPADEKPCYGDLILIQAPPEQKKTPWVTTYDRYTTLIAGSKYAVIYHVK